MRWLISLFWLLLIYPACAESLVVQTCGTLPLAYKVGTIRSDTIDVNGNRCGVSSGSSSTPYSNVQIGANSTLTFSVPGVAGKFFYLTGFNLDANGVTTAANITLSSAGLSGGSTIFGYLVLPQNSTAAQVSYNLNLTYPWQGATIGNGITISVPAFGGGNTGIIGKLTGYYQ